MKRNAVLLVSLTLLHLALRLARGDYTVSVRLSSYSNPSHHLANGRCCDLRFSLFRGFFCDQCDNYFVICAAESCLHTGEVGGDRLRFRRRVGKQDNPMQITVPGQWSGSLALVIDVYDDDDFFPLINGDDFVDQFWLTIPLSLNTASRVLTYNGRHRRGRISLSVRVACSPDYYGTDCSTRCAAGETYTCSPDGGKLCLRDYYGEECDVYCRPVAGRYECSREGDKDCVSGYYGEECDVFCEGRDDDGGHYFCGGEGEKVCLAGWTQPESDCVTSLCDPPCSSEGGRCSASGQCECEEGWTGETCQECQLPPNCSPTGGYCRRPNECLCRDGFSGKFCATATPTATPTATTPIASGTAEPDAPPTSSNTAEPDAPPTSSNTAEPGAPPTVLSLATSITTPTATPTVSRITTSTPLPVATPNGDSGEGLEEGEEEREGEDDFAGGLRSEEGGEGGQVVGAVVGGLLSLLALVVLVVTLFSCLWMVRRRRRRRKQGERGQVLEDNSLTMPLVGENPIYMDQVMGSHALERSNDSHQFDNPLYHDNSHEAGPPLHRQQQDTSPCSTHTYSSIDHHRVPSVYLPGDDSPLSASLSSAEGSHQDPRYSYVERRRSGHREHHPAGPADSQSRLNSLQRAALFNHNSRDQGLGTEEEGETARPNSLHTQYFHLPLNGVL